MRTKRGVVFYSYVNITRVSRTTYYIVRFYTHFLSFDAPIDFAFIEIPIFILCIDSIFVRLRLRGWGLVIHSPALLQLIILAFVFKRNKCIKDVAYILLFSVNMVRLYLSFDELKFSIVLYRVRSLYVLVLLKSNYLQINVVSIIRDGSKRIWVSVVYAGGQLGGFEKLWI